MLSDLILTYYRRHGRDLPWRRIRDPYAIWICEVMAQQTRLETMLPYWQRWLARFPTAAALAAASLDEVLSLWAGLGYYARARALHKAARAIVERHGGRFPENPEEIAALPGIGPYTAGAVGSIAFGHRLPVVDGNVTRVLARVHALDDTTSPAGRRRLAELAAAAVPADAPGDYNQGLMDLGATICTPRDPRCLVCPLRDVCAARAAGRQAELPAPRVRAKVIERNVDLAWIVQDGRWLMARRTPGGLYGGLWELPEAERLGLSVDGEPLATHTHHLTHRTLVYRVYPAAARRVEPSPPYDAVELFPPARLETLAISSATRRLAATLMSLNPREPPSSLARFGAGASAPARRLARPAGPAFGRPMKGDPWPTPKKRSPSSPMASTRSSRASASSATTSKKTPTSPRPRAARRGGSPR